MQRRKGDAGFMARATIVGGVERATSRVTVRVAGPTMQAVSQGQGEAVLSVLSSGVSNVVDSADLRRSEERLISEKSKGSLLAEKGGLQLKRLDWAAHSRRQLKRVAEAPSGDSAMNG